MSPSTAPTAGKNWTWIDEVGGKCLSCLDEAGKFCRHCGRDWTRRNDIRTPPLPGEPGRGRLCFLRHHSGGRRRSEHICNSVLFTTQREQRRSFFQPVRIGHQGFTISIFLFFQLIDTDGIQVEGKEGLIGILQLRHQRVKF